MTFDAAQDMQMRPKPVLDVSDGELLTMRSGLTTLVHDQCPVYDSR